MIQSYNQLYRQITSIGEEIHSKAFIQKIYSSSFYISIAIRLAGKTLYLCLGRGAGKEGLWLSEERLEAPLRKIDKFLEYLRKHLSGSTYLALEMDKKDRIFLIKYAKWGRENRFYFFYNARNLYFSNVFFDQKLNRMQVFKSWEKKPYEFDGQSFDMFDEVGRIELSDKEESQKEVKSIEKLLTEERKVALTHLLGGKGEKFFKRKKKNIEGDLIRVKSWGELQKLALDEGDFSTYPRRGEVESVKMKFKYDDHYKRRDEVFEKVKKLKKAEKILTLRLSDTKENLKEFSEEERQKYENNLKIIAPVWYKKKNGKNQGLKARGEGKSYKVYSFESFELALGDSAVGNDQMRKEWGKKDDLWFHLDGDRSPHVIVKLKGGVLEKEVIEIIASVIIDASKLNYSQINLIYTNVKNLKGVKGVPGKVIFKKEKRISVDYNADWKSSLDE